MTFISGDIHKIAEFRIVRARFEGWCDSIGRSLSPVSEDDEARLWRANLFLARLGVIKAPGEDDEYRLYPGFAT